MARTVRFPTDAQESISADSAHFSGNKPLPEKDREHHYPGGSMTGFMKFLEKGALEQFEAGPGIPVLSLEEWTAVGGGFPATQESELQITSVTPGTQS